MEFPKAYNPKTAESKWYDIWQKNELYKADAKSPKPKYSILMPPPNVTGILHLGHVLNMTIQDIYIRWKKLNGFEVCWFPGTDHAGISTQSKVEQYLKSQNITRFDLGREKFIEKVWEWKEKYGGIIIQQKKLLGIACDWSRFLFTMDESASNAVQQVFIRLFDEGLIYRGKRIINWSPLAQTAISDEEVEFREVKEHLYTLKYYFKNSDKYLSVATVRPETIFGDVAVAVNPEDPRYKQYIGQTVIVPLVNREVKIIADNYADPTFGTGCVKVTPAHDPNDFEVGLRHNLEQINAINPDATLNEYAGEFAGLDRFVARKKVVEKLKELNLIEKIEDYVHNVGFSQRGGEPVEPYLSDQWFVKMKPLAEKALEVVLNGSIKFHPSHFVKTYEHWMTNIRDWCISRQLWWGHRIPVYYTPDGKYTAASDENEARRKLNLSSEIPLTQDPDVLDTWFSSWLWPLTTMRWLYDGKTEETEDLKVFFPTDLLVTAPDIIFFWVARMIMATTKFKNEIPFKDVYFTSTIRDQYGRKLSKSLGNSPDPINIIDKYGADAVRFTSVYLAPLGQDIRMDVNVEKQDVPSMEIGRNFANKIWNAGRFLLMKKQNIDIAGVCPANENKQLEYDELSLTNKWILSRLHSTIKEIHYTLDNFKVNDYSKTLYEFIWRDFCDWYIEIFKIELQEEKSPGRISTLVDFAIKVYQEILKLLHPVMPFITEEIYHLINNLSESESISNEKILEYREDLIDDKLENDFGLLQSIIEQIRAQRAILNILPQTKLEIFINCPNDDVLVLMNNFSNVITNLAKCSNLKIGINLNKPDNSVTAVYREIEIFMILDQEFDKSKELQKLEKEIERLTKNIEATEKKLNNANFVEKAPENVVRYEREKLESMKESLKKVLANYNNLK